MSFYFLLRVLPVGAQVEGGSLSLTLTPAPGQLAFALPVLFRQLEMPPASVAYREPAPSPMPGSNEASPGLDSSLLRASRAHAEQTFTEHAFRPPQHCVRPDPSPKPLMY